MTLRSATPFLLLWLAAGVMQASADARDDTSQPPLALIEQLRHEFEDASGSLPIRGFEGTRALPWRAFGLRGCAPPRLASPAPVLTAISVCRDDGRSLMASSLRDMHSWILWEHLDGAWQVGEVVAVAAKRRGAYGRLQPVRRDKEETPSGRPLSSTLINASADELIALEQAWEAVSGISLDDLDDLEPAFPPLWPPGLMALKRDGQLLVRDGRLAGLGSWQRWIQMQAWPDVIQGVAGAGTTRRIDYEHPPEPVLLLESLTLNETPHAIVVAPKSSRFSSEAIVESARWQLLLVRLDT
ncbi:hypothetical protein [Halomonas heilongjiangensis]|uniref:Uncharacterized protein n=1 Tax=Halomonas heilongjiangensis TaxID=1387883 RepID=A0A2N7TP22_9GAMM|nr:hypothetical protein [Halomonas heilongjiangensis]PMR69930.1 hypothetical protein C1H66_08710 [Halomonas heilongjiangensis]PXX94089.1 hypothetical protein CR158_01900 [Halomonas heilongjiangensis]